MKIASLFVLDGIHHQKVLTYDAEVQSPFSMRFYVHSGKKMRHGKNISFGVYPRKRDNNHNP